MQLIWLPCIVFVMAISAHLNAQVFVDASAVGANDGTSWANAYTDLQVALSNTFNGEIWVAAGTYYPTTCTPCLDADRAVSFDLKSDVALYGGFDGTETNISQRDFLSNITTLSGDIGTPGDSTDNSYHVVLAENVNNAAILDGFNVVEGNANNTTGDVIHGFGGGFLIDVRSASAGPQFANCTFTLNYGGGGGGGCIFAQSGFTTTTSFTNCQFVNNACSQGNVTSSGGGLIILASFGANSVDLVFTDCAFSGNITGNGGDGAGMSMVCTSSGTTNLTVTECSFTNNVSADRAGAVFMRNTGAGSVNTTYTNCTFTNNTAGGQGGAVYDRASFGAAMSTQFIACDFSGNQALGTSTVNAGDGGAIYLRGSQSGGVNSATLNDCTITGNTADGQGGGLYIYGWLDGDANITVSNSSISGNNAKFGGGITVFGEANGIASLLLDQSEVSGNIVQEAGGPFTEGSGGGIFVHTLDGGEATLTGTNSVVSSNVGDAFGGGIYLYPETTGGAVAIDLSDCTIDGNSTQGGGGGIMALLQNTVPFISNLENCTISNNIASQSIVSFGGGVFYSTQTAEYSATFTGCDFTGNASGNNDGGGMALFSSGGSINAVVDNCTFTSNTVPDRAGALHMRVTSPGTVNNSIIKNCTFEGNIAGGDAGAVYDRASFEGVSATRYINCLFRNNQSTGTSTINDGQGGAIVIRGSQDGINESKVINCIFENNTASDNGGAIFNTGILSTAGVCQPEIVNCTFYGNSGPGNAIHNEEATPFIRNSIFWGASDQITDNATSSPTLENCLIQGGYSGPGTANGIIDEDPLFMDQDNSDFHLNSCSPAIDVGLISVIPVDIGDGDNDGNSAEQIDYDYDLVSRIVNGEVDLGALEYQGAPSDFAVSLDSINVSCNGICDGTLTANVSGGTPGYNVQWSTGNAGSMLSGLCPGMYSVTATDAVGCTLIDSAMITEPDGVMINSSNDTTVCAGESISLSTVASGGTGAFSYSWNQGLGEGQLQSVSPLITTEYIVTATDENNCEILDTVIVNIEPGPIVSISGDTSLCTGETSTIDAGAFSSYSWSTGEMTQTIDVSSSGVYSVTVSDGGICDASDSIEVVVNANPQPMIAGDLTICSGETTTLDAGMFASYNWTGSEITQTIEVNSAGSFAVTVTDENGCTGNSAVMVQVNPLPNPEVTGDTSICSGESTTLDAGTFSSYTWSNGSSGQTVNINQAGTISVTVTDANGCTGSDATTIVVNTAPAAAIAGDLSFCQGEGTILDAGEFDGYLWSTSETTPTISASAPGSYSVTVTDVNGCTGSTSVIVNENVNPLPVITGVASVCEGEPATLETGAFDAYVWSTGESTQSISVSLGGVYVVTVTDNNSCTGTASFEVTVNSNPVAMITGDTSFCDGDQTVLDGGDFASYNWSTGASTQEINVNMSGVFAVTVTDNNGCTGADQVTIVEHPLPTPVVSGELNICSGETSILNAGTYSDYAWSTGEMTASITVSLAGGYGVTVTDENGCMGSTSVQLAITEIVPEITGQLSICVGDQSILDAGSFEAYNWSDGSNGQTIVVSDPGVYGVTVTDSGGCTGTDEVVFSVLDTLVPEISGVSVICEGTSADLNAGVFDSYLWSNGAVTQTINVLDAGTYSVTVSDASGCTGSDVFFLAQADNPIPIITGETEFCNGESSVISVGAFEGYLWSSGAQEQSIQVFDAGVYFVTVTDVNGCTGTAEAEITVLEPPVPVITGDTAFCPGASATLDAGDYEFILWSDGSDGQLLTTSVPGNYTVTVTDAAGCTGVGDATVIEFDEPQPQILGSPAFCTGGSTTLSVPGFEQYDWSNGETTSDIIVDTEGDYSVTVTDENGCIGSAQVVVIESPELQPQITGDTALCAGEQTVLTAGTFGSYEWSTGETSQSIVVDQSGVFAVTVSDGSGCSGSAQVEVTFSDGPVVEIEGPDTICTGSVTALIATGGEEYFWSTLETTPEISIQAGGIYTVTATDSGGCTAIVSQSVTAVEGEIPIITGDLALCYGDTAMLATDDYVSYSWSTGESTPVIIVDESGSYSLTITDTNGCTGESGVILEVADELNPVIQGQLSFCEGNTTTLIVEGFDEVLWSDGSSGVQLQVEDGGIYAITVTDASGCTGVNSVEVLESETLSPQIIGDTVICDGGELTLDAGTYDEYTWSTGFDGQVLTVFQAGWYSVTVSDASGCSGVDSIQVVTGTALMPAIIGESGFCAGDSTILQVSIFETILWSTGGIGTSITVNTPGQYQVTVTDISGCTGVDTIEVEEFNNPTPEIGGSLTFCTGGSTTLSAGNYDAYQWSTDESTALIEVDQPGQYRVTVTDANGCIGFDSVVIVESDELEPVIAGSTILCSGLSTTLSVGDFASYEWSTGGMASSISVNTPGVYSVTVTDGSGCSGDTSVVVEELAELQPEISGNLSLCNGSSTELTAGDYDVYEWSTGDMTMSTVVFTGGVYSVTVTDENGCTGSDSVEVVIEDTLEPVISGSTSICTGSSTILDAGEYDSFTWSTGGTTQSVTISTAGVYSVTVTDSGGCTGVDSVEVIVSDELAPEITGDLALCEGMSTTLNAGDFESYTWSTGDTSTAITVSEQGVYSVTVSDGMGCTGEASVVVNIGETIDIEITGPVELCSGESATLEVNGTFDGYEWSDGSDMSALSISGGGLFSVTVTDVNGCSGSAEINVDELALPEIQLLNPPDSVCLGETVQLFAESIYATDWMIDNAVVEFSTVDQVVLQLFGPSLVTIIASTSNACGTDTVVHTIVPVELPEIDAGDDQLLFTFEEIQLQATGAEFYSWTPGENLSCTECAAPVFNAVVSTTFFVTGMNAFGCTAFDSVTIILDSGLELDPVNAITPNGDGVNDAFVVRGLQAPINSKLIVFNRWGDTVFEAINYKNDWEGTYKDKPLPAGSYLYILETNIAGRVSTYKGTITIIRE